MTLGKHSSQQGIKLTSPNLLSELATYLTKVMMVVLFLFLINLYQHSAILQGNIAKLKVLCYHTTFSRTYITQLNHNIHIDNVIIMMIWRREQITLQIHFEPIMIPANRQTPNSEVRNIDANYKIEQGCTFHHSVQHKNKLIFVKVSTQLCIGILIYYSLFQIHVCI